MSGVALEASTEVGELLARYFDGLYTGDAAALAEVFHPQALYATVSEGSLVWHGMDTYLPIVAARDAPASRGEVRRDAIESVEFAGAATALARVRCSIGNRYFTDFLSLIRLDGRWMIIAKVFHYDLLAEGA